MEKEDDAMTGVIKGQAAVLVLQKALESFPASIVFRKQLLEYASSVQFPGCGDLIDKIFASIVKDFPKVSRGIARKWTFCFLCISPVVSSTPSRNQAA